jgi:hypothetical protein
MNINNPQSLNRYSYVGNEPTNLIDPSGLDPTTDAAVSQAQDLLRFSPCNNAIKKERTDNPARELQRIRGTRIHPAAYVPEFTINPRTLAATPTGMKRSFSVDPSTGYEAQAETLSFTATRGGRTTFIPVGIYINLSGYFYGYGHDPIPIYDGSQISLSSADRNAMLILHELRHWMGNTTGANGTWTHAKSYNQAIFVYCFLLNPRWRNRAPLQTTDAGSNLPILNRPLLGGVGSGGGDSGPGGGTMYQYQWGGNQFDWIIWALSRNDPVYYYF